MKKVYLVIQFIPWNGYDEPKAAFSSEDLAEEYIKELRKDKCSNLQYHIFELSINNFFLDPVTAKNLTR